MQNAAGFHNCQAYILRYGKFAPQIKESILKDFGIINV